MAVVMKTRLRELREGLAGKRVSQEKLAHQAGLSLQGYRNVESGSNTSYSTAQAILAALNAERKNRGQGILRITELHLKIV